MSTLLDSYRAAGYPPLDRDALTEVATRLVAAHGRRRQEFVARLCGGCARLAAHAVRHIAHVPPDDPGWDDFVADALAEVAAHAGDFDPARGVAAGTYFRWWIAAAVKRRVRRRPILSGAHRTDSRVQNTPEGLAMLAAARNRPVQFCAPDARAVADPHTPETRCTAADESDDVRRRVRGALARIRDVRERFVLEQLYFADPPRTLAEVGRGLDLSRERVRQIAGPALEKLARLLGAAAPAAGRIVRDWRALGAQEESRCRRKHRARARERRCA